MSAIDNAVALMNSSVLMNKVRAASVYVARIVVLEEENTADHVSRMRLASAVVWNPQQYNTLLLNIISCDPDVAGVASTGEEVTDSLLIEKITALWSPVAQMLFPV